MDTQQYNAALAMLARRDHSKKELFFKLTAKYSASPAAIQEILHRLQENGLQSDRRYADAYTRARTLKGFGPARIEMELLEKGIEKPLIEQTMSEYEGKWPELVHWVWQKKFSVAPRNFSEKMKQGNFLRYRGFRSDQINGLFME